MTYLMNIHTGSVDTRENWRIEFSNTPIHEWHGYESEEDFNENFEHDDLVMSWDFCLVDVQQDDNGVWEII